MGREQVSLRVWAWTLAVAIAAATMSVAMVMRFHPHGASDVGHAGPAEVVTLVGVAGALARSDWAVFGLFVFCAAVANKLSTKSAAGGTSFRFTSVFIIAGAVLLPPAMLTLLPVLAVAPDWWLRRHRPRARVLVGWIFNAAQTVLAAQTASLWVHWLRGYDAAGVLNVAVLLGAAAIFTLIQAVLVGAVIALDRRIPITRADTFTVPALLSDGLIAVLGVLVGALWLASPGLLLLVPLLLLIAYRLTQDAHLSALAEVDGKTGLHNSRYFERMAQAELAHSQRVKRPLALLFADLDHFKDVNDRFGHAAGDEVLQQIGSLLARTVRKGDLLARFGGEEFVVLLPGTDADEASYLAERIRSAVSDQLITLANGDTLQCTVSIGVASFPQDGTNFAQLFEQADAAMYRAKQSRNAVARVEAFPPVPRLRTSRGAGSAASVPAGVEAEHRLPAPPPRSALAAVVLWGNVAAGLLAVGWSLVAVHQAAGWRVLLPFLLAAAGAEFVKVRVYEADRDQKVGFSFAVAVAMAAVVVAPFGAPLVSLLAAAVHVGVVLRQRQLDKALFNLTNLPLAAAAASGVYLLLGAPAAVGEAFTLWQLAGASAAVLAYYVVNTGPLLLMISLHSGQPLPAVLRDSAWYAPTKIFLGLIGAYLAGVYTLLGPAGAIIFAVPLVILRYSLVLYARKSEQTIVTLRAAKAEVEQAHEEKEQILRKLIETVASIIDARDKSVSGHSYRVARYAVALGRELGLKPTELALLHTAGLLHDLGKVGIPEALLHKPSRLTLEEYQAIKEHAACGERILAEVPQLANVARIIGEHHERHDGAGYPRGLGGKDISIAGRTLAVADALETILADRPYARPRELYDAVRELDRCAGTQFDPMVVAAVHRVIDALGPEFFTTQEQEAEPDWSAGWPSHAAPWEDTSAATAA
ncbi:MAG: diguanylate cyclase [Chloroflexi bacterium]|nr:diguanylate cyclase [Chloroflexota bacterium]